MMVAPLRTPGLFFGDEADRLLAGRRLRAEQHRREAVQRHAFRAIDDRGRKIFVAQPGDPLRELPAE